MGQTPGMGFAIISCLQLLSFLHSVSLVAFKPNHCLCLGKKKSVEGNLNAVLSWRPCQNSRYTASALREQCQPQRPQSLGPEPVGQGASHPFAKMWENGEDPLGFFLP